MMGVHEMDYKEMLENVRDGRMSVDEAVANLEERGFVDIGIAKVDTGLKACKGSNEVIYGEGKSAEQIISILQAMQSKHALPVIVTRLSEEKAAKVQESISDLDYRKDGRIGILGDIPEPDCDGTIAVITAGTSDIPVAEEAAVTAEVLGNHVARCYDAGVAGIHRLFAHMDMLKDAKAIIVIAGMEGALASVVGGLVSCPVIAVPTSVGYGASFGGVSALLSMLNSCASGVSVVNIDNGFGAAYQASLINHMSGSHSEKLIRGIHHVCIRCNGDKQLDDVVNFYRDVMGIPVCRHWGSGTKKGAMLDTGDGIIELFADADEQLPRGVVEHFALRTDDVDKAVEAARSAGMKILIEPRDDEVAAVEGHVPLRIAFFEGPAHEKVELFCIK